VRIGTFADVLLDVIEEAARRGIDAAARCVAKVRSLP